MLNTIECLDLAQSLARSYGREREFTDNYAYNRQEENIQVSINLALVDIGLLEEFYKRKDAVNGEQKSGGQVRARML